LVCAVVLLVGCNSTASQTAPASIGPSSSGPSASALASVTATETPPATGWRPLEPGDAPAGREDHTWTISPDGATAYLFGGRSADGTAFDDLWAYDLAANRWEEIDVGGPPARFGHNAAWVDGVGLVIFAGQSPASFYGDLWAFDPAGGDWTQLPVSGELPVARYGSCAGVGPDGRLWISHGFTSDGSRFADTRAYDFTTGAWTDETPTAERPTERCLHGCWWTDDGRLALYAGQTTGVPALGDLWQLQPGPRQGTNEWSRIDPDGRRPADRQLYASARWDEGTIVFGGGALDGGYLSDTWLIDDAGAFLRVRLDGESPPPRSGAELIPDPDGGRLLLFGGRDSAGTMNDLWELRLPGS
jgi:hypothetical protein